MSETDWLGLQVKELLWYQMLIRALIVFIMAIAFIRIAGMRSFGTKSAFDIVLSITIGAVLSRCITGHYPFFSTMGAAFFLALLHRGFAWLNYRYGFVRKLVEGEPVELFRNQKLNKRNMKKYSIHDIDVMQAVRRENLDTLDDVKSVWLEADGKITIVKKK